MIRTAGSADAASVAQMIRAMCIEIEHMGGHQVSRDESLWSDLPAQVDEWLSDQDRALVVAVASDGNVVGFGHCQAYLLGAAFAPRKMMHVGSLYVEPRHRKNGFGKLLMDAMLAWATSQGCEACELNVYSQNPAFSFYQRLGFQEFQVQMQIDLSHRSS